MSKAYEALPYCEKSCKPNEDRCVLYQDKRRLKIAVAKRLNARCCRLHGNKSIVSRMETSVLAYLMVVPMLTAVLVYVVVTCMVASIHEWQIHEVRWSQ